MRENADSGPEKDGTRTEPWGVCGDTMSCDTPIYPGDEYYEVDGYILCGKCGRAYMDELYRRRAGN